MKKTLSIVLLISFIFTFLSACEAKEEEFVPEISVRTSMTDFKKEEWLVNLPLYAINQLRSVVQNELM